MGGFDNKNIGDLIDSSDYNEHSTEIIRISGSYNSHSGNKDIHFPSSNIRTWLDEIYAPTGIWKKSGDNISYSGGKVGIGMEHPSTQLHVYSGAAFGKKTQIGAFAGFVNIELTPDDGLGYNQALKMRAEKTGLDNLYGFNGTAIGANTRNVALYGYAAGATTNYGIWIDAGQSRFDECVGVGTTPDTNYMIKVAGGVYANSISAQTISGGNILGHLPSAQLKLWFDGIYAPTGITSDSSSQVALSSGLKVNSTYLYHDGPATQLYILGYTAISTNAHKAYASSQLLEDLAFTDQATQSQLKSGSLYQRTVDWFLASAAKYTNDYASGVNYSKAYASAQIALYNETSSQVTLSSGLTSDKSIYHAGETTQMYLDDIPQVVIKSGSNWQKTHDWYIASAQSYSKTYNWMGNSGQSYSKAYASAQLLKDLAFLNQSDIDDNYYPSSLGHHLSGAFNTLSGSYVTHSSNKDIHFPSSNLTAWLDGVYAPTGTAGQDNSSQVALSSGLKCNTTSIWHDGPATQLYIYEAPQSAIKSGAIWTKAYKSAQIALYTSSDTSSQVTLKSGLASTKNIYHDGEAGNLYILGYSTLSSSAHKAYASSQLLEDLAFLNKSDLDDDYFPSSLGNILNSWYEASAQNYSKTYNWMGNSGQAYSKAYASAQIAVYTGDYYPSALGKDISGAFWAHSSNADKHFPSSSITSWLNDVYLRSGITHRSFSSLRISGGIIKTKSIGESMPYIQIDRPNAKFKVSGQMEITDDTNPVLYIERHDDSVVAGLNETMVMGRSYTGNPSSIPDGFGAGIYFKLQDTAGNMDYAGLFGSRWIDSAAGSENMQLCFNAADGGTDPYNHIKMVIDSQGNVGIGYCPLAILDYKLKVSGSIYAHNLSAQTISGGTIIGYLPSSTLKSWFDGVYAPTGSSGDNSGQISLSSGLKADSTSIWGDGPATSMYLYEVPQKALKSGLVWTKAYKSAQIAYYNEADLTAVLDDTYFPSSLGHTLKASYESHSGNADKHFPSSNLLSWLDGVYAPTGTTGADASAQVTLASGLSSDHTIWHDGEAAKLYIRNYATISSNAATAIASSQLLEDLAFVDQATQAHLKSGTLYQKTYDWYVASAQSYSNTYEWMGNSGQSYSKAYASAQLLGNLAFEDQATQAQLKSGSLYQTAYEWFVASSSKYSNDYASGVNYSKAYASAQIALYNVVDDSTPQLGGHLDAQGSYGIHNLTFLSSQNISGNIKGHLPSSQLKDWFDGVYAPTGAAGDNSGQVSLSSGLTSDHTIWHDGPATQMYLSGVTETVIKSGANYSKAHHSAQIAMYNLIDDTTPQLGGDLDANSKDIYGITTISSTSHVRVGGETRIGPTGWDLGDYRLQVSGDVYLSGNVTFKGSTFSGLAAPTFNSGAANKKYVDDRIQSYKDQAGETVTASGGYITLSGQGSITVKSGSHTFYISSDALGQSTADGLYFPSSLGHTINGWYEASAQNYSTAYASAQIAYYNEADLTAVLDDNYYPSSLGYELSGSFHRLSGNYVAHSSNTDIHFPSSSLLSWLNGVYAPTGTAGQDSSSQISLSSGLKADSTSLWGDGPATNLYIYEAPQKALKSGANWQRAYEWFVASASKYTNDYASGNSYSKAYASAQIAAYEGDYFPSALGNTIKDWYEASAQNYSETYEWMSSSGQSYSKAYASSQLLEDLAFIDQATQSHLKSGANYQRTYEWFTASASKYTNDYASGVNYSKAYASAQIAYYNEADLTAVLDDNYYPSSVGHSLKINYVAHSSNKTIHYPSSNLKTWFDGVYAPTGTSGTDSSSQVTLASGLNASNDIYHDGEASTLYIEGYINISTSAHKAYASSQLLENMAFIDQATQSHLKSGAQYQQTYEWFIASAAKYTNDYASGNSYSKAYASAQIAMYNLVDDTTPQLGGHIDAQDTYGLDDVLWISSQSISGGTIVGHLPSSQLKTWFDGVYAPTGAAGDSSGQITLSSGLKSDTTYIWGDGPATQLYLSGVTQSVIKSGAIWTKAYKSSQLLEDLAFVDQATQAHLKSGALYQQTYEWFTASAQNYSEVYEWMGNSGQSYSKAYASAQIALYGGADISAQVTLVSGLASIADIYHDGEATTMYIKNYATISSNAKKGHASGEIALYNIVEDTTPQLGGNLDGNSKSIYGVAAFSSTSHARINGELKVGPNGWDLGDYRLQVSGSTFLSGLTIIKGSTISGLADPTYASGVSNKHYVDATAFPSSLGNTLNDWYTASAQNYSEAYEWMGSSGQSYSKAYASAQIAAYAWGDISSAASLEDLNNVSIASAASGEMLMYKGSAWGNELPPMTFNIANIRLSAQQNINVTKFTCPAGKKCYIWQAAACNSGGSQQGGLFIQLLSGTTSVYKTSSATLQQGNPLAVSNGGDTEIRFAFSGTGVTGKTYGAGFMQVSVY